MKCPFCSALEVRLSRHSPRHAFLYEAFGYEKYRCRECRKAFWEKTPDGDEERKRRKRQRGWGQFFQTRARRRLIEITLFLTMLIVFFFAIRYMVSRTEVASPAGFVVPNL
jgi:transposase-like protein